MTSSSAEPGDTSGNTAHTAGRRVRSRAARLLRHPLFVALLILCISAAAIFALTSFVEHQSQVAAQARFDTRTERVTVRLRRLLNASETVLYGARAALDLSPSMTPDTWQQYVEKLELDSSALPIHALGYADVASAPAGIIGNTPLAGHHLSVTLLAPAGGLVRPDLFDEDSLVHAALLRAAQDNQVTLAVHFASDADAAADNEAVLLLCLPRYSGTAVPASPETRRTSPRGFLFASLDTRRLFEPLVAGRPGIELNVQAGRPGALIYATDSGSVDAPGTTSLLRKTDTLTYGGMPLTLVYTANGSASATGADVVTTTILLMGIGVAVALAGLAYALTATYAKTRLMPDDAKLNEARMMGIIRSSMEAIITIDEAQTVVIFNPMAEHVFGVSAMEAIGAPLSRFIPERFRQTHGRHVEQFGVTGVSERLMGRQRVLFGLRANGEEFPIEASISQIRDATGKLYTVMLRDVTERLRADNALKQSREELRDLSANLQNVREEEKTRIARELHDDLGQQLTALKMDLSAVEQTLDAHPPAQPDAITSVAGQLHSMRRLIDSTVASVRRIAADLRPVMLDDLGLVPAIEWLANDFTNRYGIDVERHIEPGDTHFARRGATTLFRIVQEALTNVARHADATLVVLTLEIEGGYCVLRIVDNGRGSDAGIGRHIVRDGHADKSFGLIGIRERAHMLGGTVTIDTSRDRGFALTVAFPLQAIEVEDTIP